jgi:hypothetical protein
MAYHTLERLTSSPRVLHAVSLLLTNFRGSWSFTIKGPSDSTVRVHIRWVHLIESRESFGIAPEQHLAFRVSTVRIHVTHFGTELIEFNSP